MAQCNENKIVKKVITNNKYIHVATSLVLKSKKSFLKASKNPLQAFILFPKININLNVIIIIMNGFLATRIN